MGIEGIISISGAKRLKIPLTENDGSSLAKGILGEHGVQKNVEKNQELERRKEWRRGPKKERATRTPLKMTGKGSSRNDCCQWGGCQGSSSVTLQLYVVLLYLVIPVPIWHVGALLNEPHGTDDDKTSRLAHRRQNL